MFHNIENYTRLSINTCSTISSKNFQQYHYHLIFSNNKLQKDSNNSCEDIMYTDVQLSKIKYAGRFFGSLICNTTGSFTETSFTLQT